jgi:hypothetical protein
MGRAEAIRHLISGGFYPHESHQLPHCTEWIEAGTGIRSFMKQSDVFMKLYGLADAHNSRLEDHGPGTTGLLVFCSFDYLDLMISQSVLYVILKQKSGILQEMSATYLVFSSWRTQTLARLHSSNTKVS